MKLPFSALAADDIFISYSRRDGATYAVGIADELTRRGFACFFDRLGTDADRNLPASLREKITACDMLVVVGSPAARESAFVAQEIDIFVQSRGSSRVVPIYFDRGQVHGAWPALVGIAPELEEGPALDSGNPSLRVVNRIEKLFKYARSKDRLRRYTVGAALTLMLLIVASMAAALVARRQLTQARLATAAADTANTDRYAAEARASAATTRATSAEDDARRAQASAADAAAEAARQQWLADAATQRAIDERLKADREALNAKAEGLVSLARGMATSDPLTASLLLSEVRSPVVPAEAVAVARQLLGQYVTKATLTGHRTVSTHVLDAINDVAYSPDGTRVATAGVFDRTARVWTTGPHSQSIALVGHESGVRSVDFSADGQRLLTASDDGTARVWQVDGSRPTVILRGRGPMKRAVFTRDGARVLTYGGEEAALYPADGVGRPIIFRHPAIVECAVLSPDETRLFTGGRDGKGRIWALGGGGPIEITGGGGSIVTAQFSPEGTRIAFGSESGGARVWRADGSREIEVVGNPRASVSIVTFSPDGTRLAIMPAGESLQIRVLIPLEIRLWQGGIRSTADIASPDGTLDRAETIKFSKDGRHVLVAWRSGTAAVWNADGSVSRTLRGHTARVSDAEFSPDEREIVTVSDDATVRIWTRGERDEPLELPGAQPHFRAHFSPDGQYVVAVGYWPRADAPQQPIYIWPADGGRAPTVFLGHTSSIEDARFSPDGSRIVSGGYDRTVRIWAVDGGRPPIVLGPHPGPVRQVAFTPDGSRVAAVVGGAIYVWRADGTGAPVVLRGHQGAFNAFAITPDGRRVVAGGEDGTVRILPLDRVTDVLILRAHERPVGDLRVTPDGQFVISISADGRAVSQALDGSGVPVVLETKESLTRIELIKDGSEAALVGRSRIVFWNLRNRGVRHLEGPDVSASFSRDGQSVVTASRAGYARVWRTDGSGLPIELSLGETETMFWAEFSPDGARILTVSSTAPPAALKMAARIWTITFPRLVEQLRARSPVCLSINERLRYLGESADEATSRSASCQRGL